MQALIAQLAPPFFAALGTVIVALVGLAANALRKKLKSELALNVLDKLTHLTTDAVLEAENTAVPALKAAASDGLLTKEDGVAVSSQVLSRVKAHLGEQGTKDAVSALGLASPEALDSLLKTKLEASVASLGKTVSVISNTSTDPTVDVKVTP